MNGTHVALSLWIILAVLFVISLLKKKKSLRATGILGLLVVIGLYALVIFAEDYGLP